ncbi:MAG: glycosyltransferase family 2 protein [Candidatus Omnitrophica bacterium]|nr:glycosyltransferase family 2 protein [Candidatus Omnitrophota bacterium]
MEENKKIKFGIKKYFYQLIYRYLSVFVQPGNSVAEINPPSLPVSSFFKNKKKFIFDTSHPDGFSRLLKENPEYLILNGNVHYEKDVLCFFNKLHDACSRKTRVIVLYYSGLWKPLVEFATWLKLHSKADERNWVDRKDLENILWLADFEPVFTDRRILAPFYFPFISNFINRYLAPLPLFSSFCLVNILVARPVFKEKKKDLSVSVIIPARNESGNIENLVKRIPKMGFDSEIIFVEGHSRDSTWEEIQRANDRYGKVLNIKCIKQSGKGKADAVRKGFASASKDVLMILDADLAVAPEVLTDFYKAICQDQAEFLNGSRLVYPLNGKAMRFCNMIGNKFFAAVFSFLVGQRFKDTLCGTKVISRENYEKIILNRNFFGSFDPFGDFDLILGASRLCLKIREIPVRYYERACGSTNIKRWRHGALLLRMAFFAARKLRFI